MHSIAYDNNDTHTHSSWIANNHFVRNSVQSLFSSLLVVYEGYQMDDFSGLSQSASALQMEEESTNSSFVDDVPHCSEACYDADTSNSSTDYNLSIQEEISQAALHRGFGEAAARGAKNTTSFYATRCVISSSFESFVVRRLKCSSMATKGNSKLVIPFRFVAHLLPAKL